MKELPRVIVVLAAAVPSATQPDERGRYLAEAPGASFSFTQAVALAGIAEVEGR